MSPGDHAAAPAVLDEQQIRALIGPSGALIAVREAFALHARGKVTMPSALGFEVGAERGEVHVKAAHLHDTPYYSVKVASGFYSNAARGLSVSSGIMVVFDARTGFVRAVLLDNGYLTDLRTGAAGALAADLLARKDAQRVAMIGCGVQARYQLEALAAIRSINKVVVYGCKPDKLAAYSDSMRKRFAISLDTVTDVRQAVEGADIVITTTPSRSPLVRAAWLAPGAHVTAIGSDGPGKQELFPDVFARAAKIVVDSREQCLRLGEMQHAANAGLGPECIYAELGEIAAGMKAGRESPSEITVADLTGVGIQDAAVCNYTVIAAMQRGMLDPVESVAGGRSV